MSVERFKLKDNHSWKSKPGYSICVLDRGVVRFDYPSAWVLETKEGAVLLHDREPSIESCDLGVSIFRMPVEMIAELEMEDMLLNSLGAERNPYQQSEIHRVQRGDLEIASGASRAPAEGIDVAWHREQPSVNYAGNFQG